MAIESERAFTMNRPQFEKFQRVAARQKPGTAGWEITDTMAGWTTIRVPNWKGGAREFSRIINHTD